MLVLGIETSCDETGLAVYDAGRGLLAHALHSQVAMHGVYGGVVPELASRDHVRRVVPLAQRTLERAGVNVSDLDGIAYTRGPGLAGALLVGASVASALAYALAKPHAYFEEMRAGFQCSRDRLVGALKGEGFITLPAHGAYFVSIDLAASGIDMSDEAFARHAIEHGVATIPFSAFYAAPGAPPLVRLCFAKRDETLDRGAEALARAKRAA